MKESFVLYFSPSLKKNVRIKDAAQRERLVDSAETK